MSGSAMNRKYTMDVATVRERVRQAIVGGWLPDAPLMMDVLEAIANDTCADPQACAKAALEWRT